MPLPFSFISQLHPSKLEWKLKVRISRTWDYYPKNKPDTILGMEVILIDEKGERIQASLKQKLIKKFRKDLSEGVFRDIMNFEVVSNNGEYRATTNPYKINFLFSTCVKQCEDVPHISRFTLWPFKTILAQKTVDDGYIDVLGQIKSMGELTERDSFGEPSKLLDIQLRDLSDNVISCTLWGKHAEDVHSFVQSNNSIPVVLLGSLMRTKKFNHKVSLQTSRFSTKLYLNENSDDICEFKSKLNNMEPVVQLKDSPSESWTPNFSSNTIENFPLGEWQTCDQFTKATEQGTCVTYVTILAFQPQGEWYYVGCTECFTTAEPYFNPISEDYEPNKYSCPECNRNEITTSLRYKVHLKVKDHTGTATLLLWDREIIKLINKSAYQLLEQQLQFNRQGQVPQELLGLEGRNFVCTIKINGLNGKFRQSTFKVVKLTENQEIVQRFQAKVVLPDIIPSEVPSSSNLLASTISETNTTDLDLPSPITPISKKATR